MESNAIEVEGSRATAHHDDIEGSKMMLYNEDIQVLLEQKVERDMLKEVIHKCVAEIEEKIQASQDQANIIKVSQLRYIVTLDKSIQGSIKRV